MKYKVALTFDAELDVKKIEKSGDKKLLKKIYLLLDELEEHPTSGTGKPERLKFHETTTWSRRISSKHRLVYQIEEEVVTVLVLSTWGHYGDK
nr:Txe/YoeB family addiction module toxin [uncultured Pedobacter sp.]